MNGVCSYVGQTEKHSYVYIGAKGDRDLRISDLVKNPDETDI